MKFVIITLLTSIMICSNAQQKPEKIKIKDTINVTNYYIIKPYFFYNLYLRSVTCEGDYYLNSSITNMFMNKKSYGIGTQLIRKIKKMQYGLSFKYIYSKENYGAKIIFDNGEDSIHTSNSQLAQFEIGLYLGREYKFNKIKIVPSISVNYNRNVASNAQFLVRDPENPQTYTSLEVNNLYSKHILTANLGFDVSFFCHNRVSPFFGYQYMRPFTREVQQSIYDIKIVRHSNLFLFGLIYKI